jgi:K(+)-stimulated pyrophosphate-energized sodium pump
MNLVALLIAPAVVSLSLGVSANTTARVLIALAAVLIIVISVVVSKRRSVVVGGAPNDTADALTTSAS